MGDTLESGPAGSDAAVDKPIGHASTIPASAGTPNPEGRGLTAEQPGRYEFDRNRDSLRELGRGGLGRVLLAYDTHLGREVAWKEILPEARQQADTPSDGVTGTARFLREARVTGQLEHPSIVPVYELGSRADGTVYYTMKVVRGRTLREALNECTTLQERLRLLPQYTSLCQAIAFAHSRGVIHRDIKPENVMLGEFGETVVLDWGIAKLKDVDQPASTASEPPPPPSDGLRTAVGSLVGTPAYMSPEQALGNVNHVDERSDVWSLGAVLYELLTGQPLVGRSNPQAMLGVILAGRFKQPLAIDDAIPKELAAICTRALQRNREDRYAGARDLARELESFQSGARVGAYSYSSWELLARFARRNKALLSAAAVVFVLALVAAGFSWASYRKEVRAHRVAQYHMAQALVEKASALNAQTDFTSAAIYAAASMALNPANPSSSNHAPGFAAQSPGSSNTLVEAVSNLYSARLGSVLRLHRRFPTGGEPREVALTPDGSRVAVGTTEGILEVWDIDSGALVFRGPLHSSSIVSIAFSRDGRLAASGGYDGIRLWDPGSGRIVGDLQGHQREVRALVFAADGATLYSGSDDRTIRAWDVASLGQRAVFDGHRSGVMSFALSADGTRLASGSRDGDLKIWAVPSGKELATRSAHTDIVADLTFTHDGNLLSGSWDRTMGRWDGADLHALSVLHGRGAWVTSVGSMHGGRWVASLGLDEHFSLFDATTDSRLLRLRAHTTGVENLAVSDTRGTAVFAADPRTVEVWKQNAVPGVRVLGSHNGFIQSLSYSADGGLIASASFDRTVRIWDAHTGQVLHEIGGVADYMQTTSFSPDGRWLGALSRDGTFVLWDVHGHREHHRLRGLSLASSFGWSPDGSTVALGGGDGALWLMDASTKSVTVHAEIEFPKMAGVMFLDVESLLIQPFGGVGGLKVRNLKTGASSLLSLEGGYRALEWLPRRRAILWASASGNLSLLELASGKVIRLAVGETTVEFPRASRDERYLFTGGTRLLIVLDLLTGEPVLRLPFPDGLGEVAVSPDSRTLACTSRTSLVMLPFDPDLIASMRANPATQLAESEAIAGQHLEGFELRPTPMR